MTDLEEEIARAVQSALARYYSSNTKLEWPQHLYVKTHKHGLKYFGHTKQDPLKYKGSSKVWIDFLKENGSLEGIDVKTEYVTYDCDQLVEYITHAITYSKTFNIVDSPLYANKQEEDGLQGGNTFKFLTELEKKSFIEKQRLIQKVKQNELSVQNKRSRTVQLKKKDPDYIPYKQTDESNRKRSKTLTGVSKTSEHRDNISKALKGRFVGEDNSMFNRKKELSPSYIDIPEKIIVEGVNLFMKDGTIEKLTDFVSNKIGISISKSTINRRFKDIYGLSFYQYRKKNFGITKEPWNKKLSCGHIVQQQCNCCK